MSGPPPIAGAGRQRGSALVMAIFVLVLLTSLGIALLSLTQYELQMASADVRAKATFFVAEAGLEHARDALLAADAASGTPLALDDELRAAAGDNDAFDLDPRLVRPVYDAGGRITGFSGFGDDVPLQPFTEFAGGAYVAFLTNDAIDDGVDPLDDTNQRVVLTAVGAGQGRSVEVVQAVVSRNTFPSIPATILLLGPDPVFEGGKSAVKRLVGDDCDSAGVPGLYVPVVGTIGADAESDAEEGVDVPARFVSGPDTGTDTVTDVSATINPLWTDCDYLLDLASQVSAAADVVGGASTPKSELGTPAAPRTVYIDGDYSITGSFSGGGLLWVTGELTFAGGVGWEGLIFVVGQGVYGRNGAGSGAIDGAFVVANVAGEDGIMGTADDCAGDDGVPGTGDDGLQPAEWSVNGAGTGDTIYCTAVIERSQRLPFTVDQFRQR